MVLTQPFIQREDVYALNSAGQYVQALTLNNAEHGAGGAAILAPLLTKLTEDQAVESHQTYSRETRAQAASLLGFLCEFAGKDRPVESQRLWATALQESAPVSGPGYRQLNYNNGWVFFPMGSYTGIKLDVCQCTSSPFSLPPPEVTCEPYKLPWVEQQGIPEATIEFARCVVVITVAHRALIAMHLRGFACNGVRLFWNPRRADSLRTDDQGRGHCPSTRR